MSKALKNGITCLTKCCLPSLCPSLYPYLPPLLLGSHAYTINLSVINILIVAMGYSFPPLSFLTLPSRSSPSPLLSLPLLFGNHWKYFRGSIFCTLIHTYKRLFLTKQHWTTVQDFLVFPNTSQYLPPSLRSTPVCRTKAREALSGHVVHIAKLFFFFFFLQGVSA